VYAQRADSGNQPYSKRVLEQIIEEEAAGMKTAAFYAGFQGRAEKVKNDLLLFLLKAKSEGLTVAAYGAAAKGNTLLNFAGVKPDLLAYVADRNPAKQGKFMPGSRIPIVDEMHLKRHRPDRVLILPWNLQEEVKKQLEYIREWEGQFVTAIPQLVLI